MECMSSASFRVNWKILTQNMGTLDMGNLENDTQTITRVLLT